MPSSQKLVILAAPRSGSNMLCTLLNSHSRILCHHELFNPDGIFYALNLRNSSFHLADSISHRDTDPIGCLQRAWQTSLECDYVGFKMTHYQQPHVLRTVLHDHSVKKIILLRHNEIKMHVSKCIAESLNVWEDYGKSETKARCKVHINLKNLIEDSRFNTDYYQYLFNELEQSQQSYIRLDYENLSSVETHKRLCKELNVKYEPLICHSRKQNPTDLRSLIENFYQLAESCKGTRFYEQLYSITQ